MFCVSRNAYKMIIFAHSKCKRYENRKIQGVALPEKERNGQEWKSSHHGTHHGEQDKKKGGRPPTGRVRKLSKSATVKFSKPSYEALRLRARKANRKLAEYIRESALNGEVVSGHNAETVAIAKSRIYAGRTTKLSPSRTDSTNGRTYPRPWSGISSIGLFAPSNAQTYEPFPEDESAKKKKRKRRKGFSL